MSPTLLILVLAMGVIWVLFIRPQKRRQQQQRQMLDAIEPGAEVLTAAGIYGTVIEADGDEIKLEIADGVVVKVARRAIGAVIPPEVEEEAEPEALEPGDEEPAEPGPEPTAAEATDADAAAQPRS